MDQEKWCISLASHVWDATCINTIHWTLLIKHQHQANKLVANNEFHTISHSYQCVIVSAIWKFSKNEISAQGRYLINNNIEKFLCSIGGNTQWSLQVK